MENELIKFIAAVNNAANHNKYMYLDTTVLVNSQLDLRKVLHAADKLDIKTKYDAYITVSIKLENISFVATIVDAQFSLTFSIENTLKIKKNAIYG